MTQQLDVAISHLETMVERVTNSDKAIPDQDGDYFIETEYGGFFARVDGAKHQSCVSSQSSPNTSTVHVIS